MSQGSDLYLDDILEAIRRVELYTGGKSYEEFARDILVQDGVLRNLANLGEAVKRLPAELTDLQPQIEWRKIAGLPRHPGPRVRRRRPGYRLGRDPVKAARAEGRDPGDPQGGRFGLIPARRRSAA